MFARAALFSLTTLLPVAVCAEPLGLNGKEDLFVVEKGAGNIVWTPTSYGKARFSYLLPQAGVREAIEFSDTTSLYYLSHVSEMPIEGKVSRTPQGRFEIRDAATQISANWFVTPALSFGIGALKLGDTTEPMLTGTLLLAPSSTELTTLSIDTIGETRIEFDRVSLHINESSETLLYAALGDDSGASVSLSYGRRFWDALMGVDIAWAAGFEQDKGFASVQFERDISRMRGALRVTFTENKSLKVGLSLEIALGENTRYGEWTGQVASWTRQETALDRPSLRKYRRDYMAKRWKQDVTIETLRKTKE